MRIHQIRNATIVLEFQREVLLVDPMLGRQGSLPPFRLLTSERLRNPLCELPSQFEALKARVTAALISHCQRGHVDHLDPAGIAFLKERRIPTYVSERDFRFLQKKGLEVVALDSALPFFGGEVRLVPARHGRGFVSTFMEHGSGFLLRLPGEPSLYLMGDTVLTPEVEALILAEQPDYIVAHCGCAQLDVGQPILMSAAEILRLFELSEGVIIANHMDALDHCTISRADLGRLLREEELESRAIVLADGESRELSPR